MIQKLDQVLLSFGIKDLKSRLDLIEKVTLNKISKNSVLCEEGKSNVSEYFLLEGVVQRRNNCDSGEIVTTGFYMGPAVITPHFSRIKNNKSLFSIESLTDSIIGEIKVEDLDYLRNSNQEIRSFGQRIIEKELSALYFSETINRSFAAKERLNVLRKQFPNIENLIPHHIIASYLGISKVSFSRLRADFS